MKPRILAIVLTYEAPDDAIACLEAVRCQPDPPDLLVVDNGSTDATPDRLLQTFPDLHLLRLSANVGFGAGHNVGVAYALERGYDYVWLLNDDALPQSGALEALVGAAEHHPTAGIVGSVLLDREPPHGVQFAGGDLHRWCGVVTHRRTIPPMAEAVSFVCGCSMLVDLDFVRDAGPLREDYFLYYEDVEWCARAAERNWELLVAPGSRVLHNRRNRRKPLHADYYDLRNGLLFIRDCLTAPERLSARLFFAFRLFRKLARIVLFPDPDRMARLRLVMRAVADGLRDRRGSVPLPVIRTPRALP